jgi:hypothetical protein
VVELALRNESKSQHAEQCPEEAEAHSWSRGFRGIRLFHGSRPESSVAQLNPLAAAEATQSAYPTRNFALELELLKAKALVHWGQLSRNMM